MADAEDLWFDGVPSLMNCSRLKALAQGLFTNGLKIIYYSDHFR